ncbi:MAG: alpha/beta hydrolase family esterase [Deltaproteobacteria bacterium]
MGALRGILLVVALLAVGGTCRAQDVSAPSASQLCALEHDGHRRSYLLYVPARLEAGGPAALVVALHWEGANAPMMEELTGLSRLADRKGFIVAYPYGSGMFADRYLTWNAGVCCGFAWENDIDDVGFIKQLVAEVAARYPVDPNRVYVAGISNGGMLAYRLACEWSEGIAAIAVVAGALDTPCLPRAPVSVIAFHGTADRRVPYEGGRPEINYDACEREDASVAASLEAWVRRDQCPDKPWRTGNKRFDRVLWGPCLDGTEVVLYAIKGGGHTWPGGAPVRYLLDDPGDALVATPLIWEFFEKHPKASERSDR